MIRAAVLTVAVLAVATASAAAQLKTPVDWKWRVEGATGKVVDADPPKSTDTRFVAMPPGWHLTTGPATLLYHPDYQTKGNFSVEAEIFLFPGESQGNDERPRESFPVKTETRVSRTTDKETRVSDRARNDSRGPFRGPSAFLQVFVVPPALGRRRGAARPDRRRPGRGGL